MQVAPTASQCSVIVLPFARALPSKKEQWNPCQEVRNFEKEDPHRLGQPLEIETKNKIGRIVHKIRSSIRRSLLLYHNSSSTMASSHIMPQNISSVEDIASAALFTSQAKQNGEPFPTHILPSPIASTKRSWRRAAHGAWSPSYGVDSAAYCRVKKSIG